MSHCPLQPNLDQYQVVAELLRRQDDVLIELDQLNERIVQVIEDVTKSRQEVASSPSDVKAGSAIVVEADHGHAENTDNKAA